MCPNGHVDPIVAESVCSGLVRWVQYEGATLTERQETLNEDASYRSGKWKN